MKDPAKKYARMIAKAMKKAGRSDYCELESAFYRRFRAHQQSEIYREYLAKYPSIGVEKVYIGITFAQVLMQRGCSLDEALELWETRMIAGKRRVLERFIRLIDRLGMGYDTVGKWLDKDKQARDRDGLILYSQYHYNSRELEYKIHTCMYVELFEHYGIRRFCKAFCNNDLCMCVLQKSAKFIRYSDRVDGDYCHDKLINLTRKERSHEI